ncbi:hypothetical protein ACHAXT_007421 [Thalassiosira profunda]
MDGEGEPPAEGAAGVADAAGSEIQARKAGGGGAQEGDGVGANKKSATGADVLKDDDATAPVANATAAASSAATAPTADGTAYKNLKINTSSSNLSSGPNSSRCSSAGNSPRPPGYVPGTGRGIDVHPFPRGSVIEVLYVKRKKESGGDAGALDRREVLQGYKDTSRLKKYYSEDEESISEWFVSDSDDEENDGGAASEVNPDNVYLADIIDRLPVHPNLENGHPAQRFRYYVHYRELNRRMDEWVSHDRVVSPPSVGNAKIRAIKRKEEKARKQEEERKERERILNEVAMDVAGMGRRDSARNRSVEDLGGLEGGAVAAAGAVGVGGGSGAIARKRLRRSASSGLADDSGESAGAPVVRTGGGVGVGAGGTPLKSASRTAPKAPQEHAAADVVTTIAAPVLDEHEGMDAVALKEHEEVTKVKNVNVLELGRYRMDTWYYSPLPKEMFAPGRGGVIDVLYVDEFSLNFFTRREELLRYQAKTLPRGRRHPPGNEIYRCGNLSMFEVDGFEERLYCQNLCYIAKLFLDHKTLYFDVDPFLFYVLCEVDDRGYHPVGYYSKEKYSDVGYNLACILTFPSHQRKGYGRFLIAFSYELSKKEEKVGSPEKPMSDLGQQAYIPYWTSTIVDFLLHQSGDSNSMSIMDIAKQTSIMAEDIIFALNTLGILKFVNGVYFIYAEPKMLEDLAKKHPVKEPRVDPKRLHWTPYINDVKRDKFSISSKKPSVDTDLSNTIEGRQ